MVSEVETLKALLDDGTVNEENSDEQQAVTLAQNLSEKVQTETDKIHIAKTLEKWMGKKLTVE